jgi:hypothetical protein
LRTRLGELLAAEEPAAEPGSAAPPVHENGATP